LAVTAQTFPLIPFFAAFTECIWRADMPKAARIPTVISVTPVSSQKSEGHPLVTIALFSGIGLLVSLVAILLGLQLY
jgi:hypothetical protein